VLDHDIRYSACRFISVPVGVNCSPVWTFEFVNELYCIEPTASTMFAVICYVVSMGSDIVLLSAVGPSLYNISTSICLVSLCTRFHGLLNIVVCQVNCVSMSGQCCGLTSKGH